MASCHTSYILLTLCIILCLDEVPPLFDLSKLSQLPVEQQKVLLELLSDYEKAKIKEGCKDDFLSFVKQMWVAFIHIFYLHGF